MGSKKFKVAALLGLLLSLTSCATVNYSYKGKPCDTVLDTEDTVVLKCDKRVRIMPIREPRER